LSVGFELVAVNVERDSVAALYNLTFWQLAT
jgi:hypothetical protein